MNAEAQQHQGSSRLERRATAPDSSCASQALLASRRRRAAGFTLPEVLIVVALLGLAAGVAAAAWSAFLRRSETQMAARLFQKFVYQARMLSVYKGVNHFVVLDPSGRTIEIYEDSSSPFKQFDTGDKSLQWEPWPPSVSLAFPPATTSMPNPLGGSDVTDPWSLPVPDTTQAWGTALRGVVTSPTGVINSGEATPAVVGSGVVVFADGTGQTASVGIRGQFGQVRSYRFDGSAWKKLG